MDKLASGDAGAQISQPGRQYCDFPSSALPDPAGTFVSEAAAAIGCDDAYVALPLMSVLATCVGSARIRLKDSWTEPCIIWTAVVGDSGTRKTPALSAAVRPLRERQRACASDAGRPDQQAVRYVISDATTEALAPLLRDNRKGVLLVRDELAGWIGDYDRYASSRGGDVARWLSLWSGDPIVVDRRGTGSIHTGPTAVSVTGTVQPGVLSRILDRQNRENGLAARLLMAMPPRTVGRWTDRDVDATTVAALDSLVQDLLEQESHGRELPLDRDGRALFIEWFNQNQNRIAESTGDVTAFMAKLDGYCARIALLSELIQCSSNVRQAEAVSLDAVERAIALVEWFGREGDRVYDYLERGVAESALNRLEAWIRKQGRPVTARDVAVGMRAYRGASGRAEADLQGLVNLELGVWKDHEGAGRPTRRFHLTGVIVNETLRSTLPLPSPAGVDDDDAHDGRLPDHREGF